MGNYQEKQWPLPPSHMRPSSATLTSRLWNPHSYISCHFCAWGQPVACGMSVCFLLTNTSTTGSISTVRNGGMQLQGSPSCQWSRQTDSPGLVTSIGWAGTHPMHQSPSGHLHGLVPSSRLGADWGEGGLLGPFHPAVTWPRPSCAKPVLTSSLPETGKTWRLFVPTK